LSHQSQYEAYKSRKIDANRVVGSINKWRDQVPVILSERECCQGMRNCQKIRVGTDARCAQRQMGVEVYGSITA